MTFTKVEKYYLDNNRDKTPKQLAKDLGREVEEVSAYLTKKVNTKSSTTINKNLAPMDGVMARHKRRDKVVATIMTPAAAQLGDAARAKADEIPERLASHIHKPRT